MAMNQGEIIQAVRLHTRQLEVLEQRMDELTKKLYEMDEILKSPIRREIYATRQGQQQKGHQPKHSDGDARG